MFSCIPHVAIARLCQDPAAKHHGMMGCDSSRAGRHCMIVVLERNRNEEHGVVGWQCLMAIACGEGSFFAGDPPSVQWHEAYDGRGGLPVLGWSCL